jgi:tRNA(fMet)-specific endonuclease VapC
MTDTRYLLDSNICIYLLKGLSPTLAARVAQQSAETLYVSSISLAEIAVGYGASVFDALDLQGFLSEVLPLPFDQKAAMIYGTLPFKRSRFDRLIAAQALAAGLILVTNNEPDFADVPGLVVENWTV